MPHETASPGHILSMSVYGRSAIPDLVHLCGVSQVKNQGMVTRSGTFQSWGNNYCPMNAGKSSINQSVDTCFIFAFKPDLRQGSAMTNIQFCFGGLTSPTTENVG